MAGNIPYKSLETFGAVAMTAQFNHQVRSEIIKARNAFPEVVSPMNLGEVSE